MCFSSYLYVWFVALKGLWELVNHEGCWTCFMILEWDTLVSRCALGCLAVEGEEASRRLLFLPWIGKLTLLVRSRSGVLELVEAGGLTMCCTVVLEDRGGKWHLQEDRLCPRSLSLFLCLVEGCEMKGWSL